MGGKKGGDRQVTICPYCKRTVGLVGMPQLTGGKVAYTRIARHADRDPIPGVRSDTCVRGTGLVVDPKDTWQENGRRAQREAKQ